MHKMAAFCRKNGIDMFKPGCTISNLANIFQHKWSTATFCPITESDKLFWEKVRENMVGGQPIVFTRKTLVDETLTYKS